MLASIANPYAFAMNDKLFRVLNLSQVMCDVGIISFIRFYGSCKNSKNMMILPSFMSAKNNLQISDL